MLNALYESQSIPQDHIGRHRLTQLAKELNFNCNDIRFCGEVDCLKKVLVLGLPCHYHYISSDVTQRFSIPRMGLGISILLSRMACVSLARVYGLHTELHLESPVVRNAIV